MEKINIAELLKNCPRGMELDCTMFDNVKFVRVDNSKKQFPIEIAVGGLHSKYLTKEGCFHDTTLLPDAKCIIFPKGKTTWEGFVPCKFKDGDIISDSCFDSICIFKGEGNIEGTVDFYCGIYNDELYIKDVKDRDEHFGEINKYNFATEEEKQKLFDAIRANGYCWDTETKTLEKLKPKFKIGNKIRYKNGKNINGIEQGVILSITDGTYDVAVTNNIGVFVPIEEQDDWEVISHKFDIHTLKPFESKVLVRDDGYSLWQPSLWGFYDKGHRFPYVTVGFRYKQCIPYKGNEYLLGKDEMCDDYYKTWETIVL